MVIETSLRDSILDAAESLFERYGYGKTTVDEIAKEAGIGKGSIYLHFESKEDLAFAWVDRIHRRLEEQLRTILDGDGSFGARLHKCLVHRVIFRYDLFACHERSMDEALIALKIKLLGRRDAMHRLEAELIAGHLAAGVANGECRSLDVQKSASSMVTATNALMPYSLRPNQIGNRQEVVERTNDLADLLVLAVTKEPR